MRVLVVCSGKPSDEEWSFEINKSFVFEQVQSLINIKVDCDTFFIEGSGAIGYLSNYKKLVKKIAKFRPDIVHAHYGFSGLLASLQRRVPVITTFHGSDINIPRNRIFSFLASRLSSESIFVHESLPAEINYRKFRHLVPCGVDIKTFHPRGKRSARDQLGLEQDRMFALFSAAFNNKVKNYELARQALSKANHDIELLELKSCSREKVCMLMNAVDLLIVTSSSETGPLVVKEALACNCPVVSVDVGDVKKVVGDVDGCYITAHNSQEIARCIDKVVSRNERLQSRESILRYSLEDVADRLKKIYSKVMQDKSVN